MGLDKEVREGEGGQWEGIGGIEGALEERTEGSG